MTLPDFDHPGTAVTKPSFLAHVVLRTNQYHKMISWWTTFLGARVTFGNESISFITYDHEHHRIAIMRDDSIGSNAGTMTGLEHVAFTFADLPSLLLAYRQRKTHDILPESCMNHGPTTSFYYRDPDGNGAETQSDNFASAEEANEFMESKDFEKNPVGTVIDPEDLIRRLMAGESEEDLKKRDEDGEIAVPPPKAAAA